MFPCVQLGAPVDSLELNVLSHLDAYFFDQSSYKRGAIDLNFLAWVSTAYMSIDTEEQVLVSVPLTLRELTFVVHSMECADILEDISRAAAKLLTKLQVHCEEPVAITLGCNQLEVLDLFEAAGIESLALTGKKPRIQSTFPAFPIKFIN